MNHEFCINCGSKNLFEVSKPKFCAGCGKPFNTSSASVSRQSSNGDDDNAGYEGSGSFNIEKLRASIVAETSKDKKSLDDLWSNPAQRDPNSFRAPSKDPSGNEILQATMQECAQVKVAKEIGE